MITPTEIKQKAERLYRKFLVAYLKNEVDQFFPQVIPGNKGKSTDPFMKQKQDLETLLAGSKFRLGYGYIVELKEVNTQTFGRQSRPQKIYFESQDDYLKFIGKTREFRAFERSIACIKQELPQLQEWMINNPHKIIANADKWSDLLKVCTYFLQNPQLNLYIRELPIEVHTKFIEENESVLKSLLNFLLPEETINQHESKFEKRFHLKYNEPLIRIRILDDSIAQSYFSGVSDLSIPVSQFNTFNIPCDRVFITENKMNMLTLPKLEKTVAIWGHGFDVASLREAAWIADKEVIYWGDIDVHGFQILSQLRSYFPNTHSIMMDFETFNTFNEFAATGTETNVRSLENLTEDENELFRHLLRLKENNRLEQEKISQKFVDERIERERLR